MALHGPDSRLVGVIPTALSACRYKVSGCQGDTHFWPDWPDLHPVARLARVARLAPNGLHCALAVLHTHTLTTPGVSAGPAGRRRVPRLCRAARRCRDCQEFARLPGGCMPGRALCLSAFHHTRAIWNEWNAAKRMERIGRRGLFGVKSIENVPDRP